MASLALIWTVVKGNDLSRRAHRIVPPPTTPKRAPGVALPSDPVSLEGSPITGDPKAPLALIMYSDFECPFCGTFARETLPLIERDYVKTGKVALAYRHLPLEAKHPRAMTAAQNAVCAAKQGRFWELHDVLFKSPAALDELKGREWATKLGLDATKLAQCLATDALTQVRADESTARHFGITGTPSFLVGRRSANGALWSLTGYRAHDRSAIFRAC